jgi:pentatricopeptide repeat protein
MGKVNLLPNVVSYTSLLLTLARSEMTDPAKPMEQLFGRMEKQWKSGDDYSKPNLVTYNALLFGLSRSTDPSALDRAELYFKQMKQDQGLKQTALLYNTLMSAQSKRNRPDRADALFQEIKQGFKAGDVDLKPNYKLYRTLLFTWSKAGNPEKTLSVDS